MIFSHPTDYAIKALVEALTRLVEVAIAKVEQS